VSTTRTPNRVREDHPAGRRRVVRPRACERARRGARRVRCRAGRGRERPSGSSKTTSCWAARSIGVDHQRAAGALLTASATGASCSPTPGSASRRSRSSGSCQYRAQTTASASAARNDAGSRATASASTSLRATAVRTAAASRAAPADSGGSSHSQPPVCVNSSQHTRRPRGPASNAAGSTFDCLTPSRLDPMLAVDPSPPVASTNIEHEIHDVVRLRVHRVHDMAARQRSSSWRPGGVAAVLSCHADRSTADRLSAPGSVAAPGCGRTRGARARRHDSRSPSALRGPAPGRCAAETYTVCFSTDDRRCVVTDRVAVLDRRGRTIARQRLAHGQFAARVHPGTYVVELLGDGNNGHPVHGQVLQRRTVIGRARQTARSLRSRDSVTCRVAPARVNRQPDRCASVHGVAALPRSYQKGRNGTSRATIVHCPTGGREDRVSEDAGSRSWTR
jgi:hypothetical protein